jgi:hypothetical protein
MDGVPGQYVRAGDLKIDHSDSSASDLLIETISLLIFNHD